jgi:carbamoyltransferase
VKNILGINLSHDASLSLLVEGKLKGSIAIERLTRLKKDDNMTLEHITFFLENFGLSILDIDIIAFSYFIKGSAPFISIYYPPEFGESPITSAPTSSPFEVGYIEGKGYLLPNHLTRIRPPYLWSRITEHYSFEINVELMGVNKLFEGYIVDHQLAHAASAFYTSPFQQAAIFTADASMHDATSCSMWWIGDGSRIQPFRCPEYMMGNFYDIATEFCGLGPGLIKAGALMGLAAHGNVNEKTKENWKEWTKPKSQRTEEEDIIYCDWLFSQISGKFPLVGYAIPDIENKVPGYWHYTREYQAVYTKEQSDTQEVMDIAASIQYMTERSLVHYTQQLFKESENFNNSNLCLAGGLFLNCNANYKILKETGFKNIHFFPACGDDGIAAGAALYIHHKCFDNERETYTNKELMYTGIDYKLGDNSLSDSEFKALAKAISEGKIVCWYQGRSEFGPRALGNRSFLADPRNPEMKDLLNAKVKFREWYRPFAPVILEEDMAEWFDLEVPSPFMLYTVPCKKPELIPAVVHVDDTARLQTVTKVDNPNLHRLISEFKKLTGVPMLLNTSLNVKGEPIVETESEAIKLFRESTADVLVINGRIEWATVIFEEGKLYELKGEK